jgi:hypothetical protein
MGVKKMEPRQRGMGMQNIKYYQVQWLNDVDFVVAIDLDVWSLEKIKNFLLEELEFDEKYLSFKLSDHQGNHQSSHEKIIQVLLVHMAEEIFPVTFLQTLVVSEVIIKLKENKKLPNLDGSQGITLVEIGNYFFDESDLIIREIE